MVSVDIVEYNDKGALVPLYKGDVVVLPRQGETITIEVVSGEQSHLLMYRILTVNHWLFSKGSKLGEEKSAATLYVEYLNKDKVNGTKR